jgi:hypothetical protein
MKFLIYFFFILNASFILSQVKTEPPIHSAILIVGNDAQNHAVSQMDELAILLIQQGITVYKYYYPNTNWYQIADKAADCSFFIYAGHGFANGGLDGEYGGLYIKGHIFARDIIDDIQFKYQPLIIYLNACGSHGSSAGDPDDIGLAEANNRIIDTALPFFKVGAGGYFATNEQIKGFLEDFFKGKPLEYCFLNHVGDFKEIVKNSLISEQSELAHYRIGISATTYTRQNFKVNEKQTTSVIIPTKKHYGNAYICKPGYKHSNFYSPK